MNNGKNTNAARALAMGVVAALVFVSMAGTGAAVSGLVGEWHFDGNAQDSSGSGNHGTISGATFVSGISGQALSFDGVNDFVSVTDSASLKTQQITVEAWIKPNTNTIPAGSYGYTTGAPIVNYAAGDSDSYGRGYAILFENNNVFYFRKGSGDGLWENTIGTNNKVVGSWYHVVGVYDGLKMYLYIDGILENSFTPDTQGISYSNVYGLFIGKNKVTPLGDYSFFNGIIDEVRIYNRALSASEIQANYNALTSTPTPTTPAPTTPTTGSISVSSSPSGAGISLDGSYRGTAPKTLADIAQGSHTIELTLAGYEDWSQTISVNGGGTYYVSAQLKPLTTPTYTSTITPTYTYTTPTPKITDSPPSISLSKQTVDLNKNGQLDEGEKLVITYGANDDIRVKSIKVLLDGNLIELRNNEGVYTVTTDALSMGDHSIVVEAIDSSGNKNKEEMKVNAKRAGPSVYFQKTKFEVNEGDDVNVVLSAVNPIGNPKMDALLILKPPSSGVSPYESDCAGYSGQCTGKFEIQPGDSVRSISVRMKAEKAGEYPIDAEIYYQFDGGQRSPTRYETLTLVVKPKSQATPVNTQLPSTQKTPGFGVVIVIIGLLLITLLKRKR